jgi:prolyl-tRNA editing enzyme YbaK/EbsC (Cys-tRNA(Pro) deacylase)
MEYHPLAKQITDLLTDNNCWFETFKHEQVKTSEEASKVRPGYTLHQGAKALIVRVKKSEADKKFIMLVFPADLKFDNKKVKEIFKAKDIRFATQEEIFNITIDVKIGGVPPFGNLFNLEVIVDPKQFDNEKIVFNAGDRCFSVAMKSEDYKRLVNPAVSDITL